MFDIVRVYRENYRYIRYERRELAKIPEILCDPSPLKGISETELRNLFYDPEIEKSWNKTAPLLNLHCNIADDTTSAVNPGDRRALYYLARAFRPNHVLEIGTHVGASTIHIAAALIDQESDIRQEPKLITVDIEDVNGPDGPSQRFKLDRTPLKRIQDFGCAKIVRFVQQKSLEFFKQNSGTFDLIFLDGSHAASVVYQEVPLALNALSQNGVILLHDFFPNNKPLWKQNRGIVPGPWIATQRLRSEGVPIKILPLGALPWYTKLGSNVTSLAVMSRAL
jgi:predicted O-methyltransferase YrrM